MQTIELLARIDDVHERAKAKKKGTQSRGTSYVSRRHRDRHAEESTLRNLRGSQSKVYIPRFLVRPEWLATAHGQRFDWSAYMSNDRAFVAAQGGIVGGGNISEFGQEEGHEDDAAAGAEYGGPRSEMVIDQ